MGITVDHLEKRRKNIQSYEVSENRGGESDSLFPPKKKVAYRS